MKSSTIQERILQETGAMFFRHGIRTITMDDIAAKLGISKKTIYQFYSDKGELVKSFTDLQLRAQEKDMETIQNQSKDAIDEMLNLMTHLENFFNRVNPAVFYDLQKYHPQSWNAFKLFKEKCVIGFIEDNLKRGIQQELYRKDLKIKILARLRIEEVEMGFHPSVFPPDNFKITDVQLTLIDHFVHGIVTIKGFKLIEKYRKNIKSN
jgi:TetR/AcrR family transcriptional regulator, cholesterol catabolism regulator